jgi:hypothetical protein
MAPEKTFLFGSYSWESVALSLPIPFFLNSHDLSNPHPKN